MSKSPFTQVTDWKAGDELVSFRGEHALLLSVTQPNTEGRSAKVWVQFPGPKVDQRALYADVFTNPDAEARALAVQV